MCIAMKRLAFNQILFHSPLKLCVMELISEAHVGDVIDVNGAVDVSRDTGCVLSNIASDRHRIDIIQGKSQR
jgi:hypothetical protein